ncbi:MAG: FAD-dependent oxidoreductase [Pseudomonadota bacterium]
MTKTGTVAIIGASAAGVAAARGLRALSFAGHIVLIDSDEHGSYERPPLSKRAIYEPDLEAKEISLMSDQEAEELQITTRYGYTVTKIEPQLMRVCFSNGAPLKADYIVLATGGRAQRLQLEGADSEGILTLRSFADAELIRRLGSEASRPTVIGGGLIGSELVASLIEIGKRPYWLDAAKSPLAHTLPKPVADFLTDSLVMGGASLLSECHIKKFLSHNGSVYAIELSNGVQIESDLVVMGVGMTPNIELGRTSGLRIESGGVWTDASQRTSTPNILAAGDVAAVEDAAGNAFRSEHWRAAEHQGDVAAHTIMGAHPPMGSVEWFWSDQGKNHVEMVGQKGDTSILRRTEDAITAFEFQSGSLVGAASVNDRNSVRATIKMLELGASLSADKLADPTEDLRRLVKKLKKQEQV